MFIAFSPHTVKQLNFRSPYNSETEGHHLQAELKTFLVMENQKRSLVLKRT